MCGEGNKGKITDKDLLDYAWRWFEYHATQRLKAFHFFLIFVSAIGFVAITILKIGKHEQYTLLFWLLVAFIGLVLAVISSLFWLLDLRNRELVNCGRKVLDELEQKLIVEADINFLMRYYDKERLCLDELGGISGDFKDKNKTPIRHSFVFSFIYRALFILGNSLFLISMLIFILFFANLEEIIVLRIPKEGLLFYIIFGILYLICFFCFKKYIPETTSKE